MPRVIEFLYHTDTPILRHVLGGRAGLPLSEYLADWRARLPALFLGLAAVTAFLLLLTHGGVRSLIDRALGPPPAPGAMAPRAGMTCPRWLVVNATIAAMLGAQLLEVFVPGDRWPFSPYAMYASEHGPSFSWRGVYGVSDGREFRLRDPRAIAPIDPIRLSYAFADRHRREWTVVPPQDSMLRAVASLYERTRLNGDHAGLPLGAIRLYENTWLLRRDLANVEAPARHVLLHEVRLDE